MATLAPTIDPEVTRRARRVVAAAGRGFWPANHAALAVDAGRGQGVLLRWRVGVNTLVSARCPDISIHPFGDEAVLAVLDAPDPDFHDALPDGVVHLVEIDHGLSAVIPLGPPPA